MSTSVLPTFVSTLVSNLQANAALSGVRIFDGIELDYSYPGNAIAVGHDGALEGDDVNAGSMHQEYEGLLGNHSKFEEGSVNCVLWAGNGTTNLASLRTAAFALLAAVETQIRSDISFGGLVLYSDLTSGSFSYRQTNVGAGVVIPFVITYKAKI